MSFTATIDPERKEPTMPTPTTTQIRKRLDDDAADLEREAARMKHEAKVLRAAADKLRPRRKPGRPRKS